MFMKKIILFNLMLMVATDSDSQNYNRRKIYDQSILVAQKSLGIPSLDITIRNMAQLLANKKKPERFKRAFKAWLENNFMIYDDSIHVLNPDPRPGPVRSSGMKDIKSVITLLEKFNYKKRATLSALGLRKTFDEWYTELQKVLKALI